MMNGNMPQQPQPEEPPTIEGLQKQVTRLQQYLELFRQQRDNAVTACSNLQADIALANHQIQELEGKLQQSVSAPSRFSDIATIENSPN